jgi:hypothetical protein
MVSRSEVNAARLAQRKSLGRDAAIKSQIILGQSWEGADKQSAAERDDSSRIAAAVERQYNDEFKPRVKVADQNVRAAGKQLASNVENEARLLAQLGLAEIDVRDREEYAQLLAQELKADQGGNDHYRNFLAAHAGSTAEKLQALRERLDAMQKELAEVRRVRPGLQGLLDQAAEALAALAV